MKTNTPIGSCLKVSKFLFQNILVFTFIIKSVAVIGQNETYTKNYMVGSNSYELTLTYQPKSYDEVLLDIDLKNTGTTDIEMRDSAIRLVNNNIAVYGSFVPNGDLSYPTVSLDQVPDGLQYVVTLNIALELGSWVDSKLSPNETVRVSQLALGTGLKELSPFSGLADQVRFYTSELIPPLFTNVTVAIQNNNNTSVSVVLENQRTQGQSIEMITTSSNVSLRTDQEFHIWSNNFASGTLFYTSPYSKNAPLVFTPNLTNNSVTISYTPSPADVGSVDFKVTGLPDGVSTKTTLTSTTQSGVSYEDSIINGTNLNENILVSTYKIVVNSYTDTENNIIYTPEYNDSLTVTNGETTTSIIDFNATQIYPFTVNGFPEYLSHGTVTSGDASHDDNLQASELDVLFRYSGLDGAGDRGTVPTMYSTINCIAQSRRLEAFQTPRKILPLFVHYTANASGGGTKEALKDLGININDTPNDNTPNDNMIFHYRNLIQEIMIILNSEDADHPIPGSFLISPDFLGAMQQDVSADNGTDHDILTRVIDVNEDILAAFEEEFGAMHINTTSLPMFEDNIQGYFQSINYVIKTIGECKIPFGYQENVWAAGSGLWVFEEAGEFDTAANQGAEVIDFINNLELYTGPWKPDFIAFDRYERDCFGPAAITSYAWTAKHWDRYLDFCKIIAEGIGDVPIMLWQIPGGHMATTSETLNNYDVSTYSSAAGPYFLGDSNIGTNLNAIIPEVRNIQLPSSSSHYGTSSTVGDLLARDNNYDWSTSNLSRLADMNVFSILWGGGSTTGTGSIGTNGAGDDGWLADKINTYYENLVFSTTVDPAYQVFCCLAVAGCKNITVNLDENNEGTIEAKDVYSGDAECGNISLSIPQTTFDDSDIGANNVTLTITDENNIETTCTSVVTVVAKTLGIDDQELSLSAIVLYPNPAEHVIHISNPQQIELNRVSVYDLKGRKLKTYKFKSVSTEKTVDVSTLAIAPYVVVIETPQGNVVKYLIKK